MNKKILENILAKHTMQDTAYTLNTKGLKNELLEALEQKDQELIKKIEMNNKPKIVNFKMTKNGEIYVLLNNGKVYRRTENNSGPYYWVEEKWVDEIVEYIEKGVENVV